MADTWGISGLTFLVMYGGLLALTALAAWISRQRQLNSSGAPAGELDMGTYDLAMLNGGETLAVVTAVANLRESGVVSVEGGRLTVAQPLSHDAHPVERAVYHALEGASSARPLSIQYLVNAQRPTLTAVRDRLIGQGLLHHPDVSRGIRRLALWFVPVLVLGVARLMAGIANGKPVGFLVVLLVLSVLLALYVARSPVPQTPNGQHLLKHARLGGPLEGLTGMIAPLGLGALWSSDTELAKALGVQREARWAAGSGYSGGEAGDAGGGGCGGCGGCGG